MIYHISPEKKAKQERRKFQRKINRIMRGKRVKSDQNNSKLTDYR